MQNLDSKEDAAMDDKVTPNAALAALADVERLQARGRKRGTWPLWAKGLEGSMIALTVVVLGYNVWIALVIITVGVAFRFWCVKRYGTISRPHWSDGVLWPVMIACTIGSDPLRQIIWWGPIALGLLTLVTYQWANLVRKRWAETGQDDRGAP